MLRAGNWDQGWPEHSWIRTGSIQAQDAFEVTPTFGKKIWNGEKGSLLLNADFGMGDTIQFARYLDLPVDRLVLRCDEDFRSLLGIEVVAPNDPIPDCEYVLNMMALPKVLGVKKAEISGKPYLAPKGDPGPIADLAKLSFTKIGLCWSGRLFSPRYDQRSLSAEQASKMLIDGLPMFHLVKHAQAPTGFTDLRGFMGDWNQTAHVLNHLDLVISVDTAMAHLAGALGRPTWLLLHPDSDWRWEKGEKSVWYDSIRIFRQTTTKEELLERVAVELRSL